ncbi:MAG: hypothetical protein KDD34_05680 [Bdellovibrionales bacterium]|nr:hypothetical protein [Bdellovibrionales bacterium]
MRQNTNISKIQWLVEIRGQKQGPFTTHQIVERLMRKDLKIVHRVSETDGGWVAICNEPIFEQHILNLIDQVSEHVSKGEEARSKDKDNTSDDDSHWSDLSGIHNLNVKSLGISEQLNHAKELQQASVNLMLLRNLLSEIRIKRKIVITEQEKELEDQLHPDDRDQYIAPPVKISDYLSSGTTKFFMSLLVLVIGILGAMEVKSYLEKRELQEQALKDQEAKLRQKYGEAKISKKDQIASLTEDQLLKMVNQELGIDKNGKSIKWTLLETQAQKQIIKYESGEEVDVETHEHLSEALVVKAYEHLLTGDVVKAEEYLLKSIQLYSPDRAPAIILLMETALLIHANAPSNTSRLRLEEVLHIIKERKQEVKAGIAKLKVAEITILLALNRKENLSQLAKEFLKLHPSQDTDKFEVGYKLKVSWSGLLAHCISIYQADKTNALMSAVLGSCLIRSDKKDKAEPYIYYAYKKDPKNTLIRDLLGYTYFVTGDLEKSKKLLWDPTEPAYKVTPYQTKNRLLYCKSNLSDPLCVSRGSASSQ